MSDRLRAWKGIQATMVLLFVSVACSTFSQLEDICNCLALLPDVADYRHSAKHVSIPAGTPIETDVATMLTWSTDPVLPPTQPRFGRELQLMHIATAYLENASVNQGDCDIHMEISQIPDKAAPRVIIETPVDSEYCSSRQALQGQLQKQGFRIDTQHGGDLPQPVPVSVLGLPFEDFEHGRGSPQVATLWEIHPAVITVM